MIDPAGARPSALALRKLVVAAITLMLAAVVVVNAAVQDMTPGLSSRIATFWQSHPAVIRSATMRVIGARAREGGDVDEVARAGMVQLARSEPLAIEPVIEAAISAQIRGNSPLAEKLFVSAQSLQPRALAPHYYLADSYLRSGRVADGLRQLVVLARFAPDGARALPPFLAAYAREPANWGAVRNVLAGDPDLASGVLSALATDVRNSSAIFAIAPRGSINPSATWLPILLDAWVKAGDPARARAIWAEASGISPTKEGLLYDSRFTDARAPGPFNWTFANAALGLAERSDGGGAHVIFYGTQSGQLLRQLITLRSGTYQLQTNVSGNVGARGALSWTVRCERDGRNLLSEPVRTGAQIGATFTVPTDCPAQWFSLDGTIQDMAGQSDLNVHEVSLRQAQGQAR